MKKRLLSAALALAMVLTMLPLGVMPAFAASPDEGTTVTYYAARKVYTGANSTEADNDPGWYYATDTKVIKDGKETSTKVYEVVTSGVIASTGTSGKWYANANAALTAKVNSMKLIDDGSVNLGLATGAAVTIDLNGNDLTVSGSLDNTPKDATKTACTKLTIQNSVYKDAGTKTWPAVGGTITATNQNFEYVAKNTANSGGPGITVSNSTDTKARTLTVTLTDATAGDLEVSSGAAKVTVTGTTKDAAKTGGITVNKPTTNMDYGTTTIKVSGGKTGAIVLNGKGTITLSDMGETDAITLYGGKKADVSDTSTSLPKWGGSTTVNVGSQCVTKAITVASGNEAAMTVNVTNGSGSTNGVASIDLTGGANTTAHTVKVDGGKVGAISLNAGKLDILNSSDVGAVTLGEGGKTTATISGEKTKVAGLDGSASKDITLNMSNGTMSAALSLPSGYAKHSITGGTFKSRITEAGWLSNSVKYEIHYYNGDNYRYTDSFQDGVDAYKANPTGSKNVIGMIGSARDVEVTFILDAPEDAVDPDPVVVIKTDASHGITLPSKINNKTVTTWYIGDDNTPKNAGSLLKFDTSTTVRATTSAADNSKIVSVKVSGTDGNNGLSASLAGNNTIQVSGALRDNASGFMPIVLEVETAIGKKYNVPVAYAVAEKKLVPDTGLPAPFVAGEDNASLQIAGTSLLYPLDGSRIVVSAGSIGTVDFENGIAVGTVSVSLGTAEKAALKIELDGITADFSGSPAVKEAVNKVIAALSQTQVDNYIRQGRIAAYKDINDVKTNPNENQINEVADYNTLDVDVYLDIRATAWNKTVGQQSMTLNITPYYRLNVTTADGSGMLNGEAFYTVKTGSALSMSGLTSEQGDVVINAAALVGAGNSLTRADWAHHGDYVYQVTGGSFTTKHGFSPFVLSMVDPVASVTAEGEATPKAFYDNVQTAIDETEEGDTVKLYTVYNKSAETYKFTGKARTITFDPGINGSFVPTFSSNNVTADKTNGNVWTVQLNEDTTAVDTASITVAANNSGTATASATTAKVGSVVTVTVTPKAGFRANTPTVKTNTGATVAVSGSNGSYTFTVPAGATGITVTPNYVTATGLPFTDVPANSWYFNGVKYCWDTTRKGYHLMEGLTSDQFSPNGSFTRAQMVQIMYNIKGRPSVSGLRNPFSDVSSSKWYYDAIVWAANNGYADGYGDGRFYPENNVKRDELVEFLWKFAGKPAGVGNLNGYSDAARVPAWAQNSMRWAVGYSLLSGQNSVSLNGVLSAEATAKRCEVAVTVMNFDSLALVR